MKTTTISARNFAEVVTRLRENEVSPEDPFLKSKFEAAFQSIFDDRITQRSSQVPIDLPDLEENVEADIVTDNVTALSAVYFAAMLEELKFFQVADKVAEQFMMGQIPMPRSVAGESLYRFVRGTDERMTEIERKGLYARCFGMAQGAVDEPMPNREFPDLWIRFLSAISVLVRERRSTQRQAVSEQQIFKNARDLAVNLSLHGYGLAHFAAVELQKLVKDLLKVFSYPETLSAYGVNDPWQLIERVSDLYLGGAVNGVRQRTMAQTGARIMQWLVRKQPLLVRRKGTTLGILQDAPDGSLRIAAQEIDFINDVERWLAVTGTDDASVERFSEPIAMQSQPTIPNLALGGLPLTNGFQGAVQNLMSGVVGKA